MKVLCDNCGKEKTIKKYEAEKFKHHFCNKICYGEYMKKTNRLRGKDNPNYKKKITVMCAFCQKKKLITEWESKRHRNHFCNRLCKTNYQVNPKTKLICDYCGKEFKRQPSAVGRGKRCFCSRDCQSNWAKESGYYKGEKNAYWKPRIKAWCKNCGKEHMRPENRIGKAKHYFCGRNCRDEWHRRRNSPHWRGGKSFEPYGLEFNNKLRLKIRKRDNFKCQICSRKENGKAHITHHVDYDKKNNNPGNLITLCNSCHSKTNSNRVFWQAYFSNTIENLQYSFSFKEQQRTEVNDNGC